MYREALLIADNEIQFREDAMNFGRYLANKAKINPNDIHILQCNASEGLTKKINEFKTNIDVRAHAIVAYFGHGYNGGLSLSGNRISYSNLAKLLQFENPFVFINTSCHSGSAITYFNPKKSMVLTASGSIEIAVYGHFLRRLLTSYHKRRQFKARKIKAKNLLKMNFEIYNSAGTLIGVAKALKYDCYQKIFFGDNHTDTKLDIKIHLEENYCHVMHPQKRGLSLDYLLYRA